MAGSNSNSKGIPAAQARDVTYWRIEGSLLEMGALRPVGFFTWNAQSFAERWARRAGMAAIELTRLRAYAPNRPFAPRRLHTLLRGTRRARPVLPGGKAVEIFEERPRDGRLSIRETLAGRHILLIGVTGFIGKVWLLDLLENIPEIARITLLIRRNRTTSALRRFEKIAEESPAFDELHDRHCPKLGAFLEEKIEVVEGDVSQPGLGLEEATQARLAKSLDLIVNSAGLTDFNPDLPH